MKKAFTLIEFLFVILIISILSISIIPNIKDNSLYEAATQVVTDIRYTQHLAMIDDKFDKSEKSWYKRRWTIRFRENLSFTSTLPPIAVYDKIWAYTIYSDTPNYNGREPDLVSIAKDPLNKNKYLSGGWDNTLHVENKASLSRMRLGEKYGIKDVKFSGGCRSTVRYVYFDIFGRPFNSSTRDNSYELASAGWHKILTRPCKISLCTKECRGQKSDTEVIITIEPETGYVHIL
jgi:prepilin-type N-terminal cleavage/methylation domain-containing protein